MKAEVPAPEAVIDRDLHVEQEREENRSAPDLGNNPKPSVIDAKGDADNKSEAKETGEEKGRVIEALDHFTKEKKNLEEEVIKPAKEQLDNEVKRLDERKKDIDGIQQELHEKKEKLDELRKEVVDEPVDRASKMLDKARENASPAAAMSKLGYNIASHQVDSCPPESVKELMEHSNPINSAVNTRAPIKKAPIVFEDKVNDVGDKIGVTRIATEEGQEHQVQD